MFPLASLGRLWLDPGMRRFEFKDTRSYKFWEIEVEGTSFTVRYGKVGTKGSASTKSFPSADKAASEAAKKIKSKTNKGYAEVSVGASPPKPAADGVDDWAVRADALQAAGDPWGERITVFSQWDQAKAADKRKLKARLKELDAAHGEHYYGADLLPLMAEEEFERGARLTWEYGYVARARVGKTSYDSSDPSPDTILAALARSPAAAFMRELVLGLVACDEFDFETYIKAIAAGKLERLESLFIGDFNYPDEVEISWTTIGDLGALLPALPALRTLRVRGGSAHMSHFEHPNLQRLEIESGGLPGEGLRGFASAKLPELTHVSLWLGRSDYDGSTDIDDLKALWSTKDLPKLRHLGLQNSEMQDAIAVALAKSEILAQIDSVDLSMGTMRAEGAQAIIDNAAAFKHLKSLKLDENFIPPKQSMALRKALGDLVHVGQQNVPEDWGDGEQYYFTTVGE